MVAVNQIHFGLRAVFFSAPSATLEIKFQLKNNALRKIFTLTHANVSFVCFDL